MKPWYDNYCFAEQSYGSTTMYNSPNMVLKLLVDNYIRNGGYMPRNMVEENIRVDYKELPMLIRKDKEFAHDASTIQTLVQQGYVTGELKTGFPAETVAEPDNFTSLLFYFGMLTISGTLEGETKLTIPNQVVREQLYSYLLDTYNEADLRFDNWEKENWHPLWLIVATGKPTSTISPNVLTDILPSATSKKAKHTYMDLRWL